MKIKEIKTWFRDAGGYLTTNNLLQRGVHTSTIKMLLQKNEIVQVKRGLYRLPADELPEDEKFTHDYFDVARAVSDGVFCLSTALFYHNMTTTRPVVFDVAIPRSHRSTKISTVSVHYYRFSEPYYSMNIERISTNIAPVRMYDLEKTVCDAIRLRHIVGEDIAMEGLNTYMRRRNKKINKLLKIAARCKVRHIVEPGVKAMVGF